MRKTRIEIEVITPSDADIEGTVAALQGEILALGEGAQVLSISLNHIDLPEED